MSFAPVPPVRAGDSGTSYVLLVSALCALFAWLAPNHEPPWASFHGQFAMALSVLILGVWVCWRSRGQGLMLPTLTLLTLLASLIPLMQLAAGLIDFRGVALLAGAYLLAFGLAQVIGQRASNVWGAQLSLETFFCIVLVGALASLWLALYQWQELDYLDIYSTGARGVAQATANFNQPNHLATMLVLGLVAAACLFDARKVGVATTLALVLLLGFGVAMTQSRAGLFEVIGISTLLILKRHALGGRLASRHVVIAALLVLLMPLAWVAANSLMGQMAQRDSALMAAAGSRRITHWLEMLDAVSRRPWWGYGWNGTVVAQFSVASDYPATHEVLGSSHNLLIDLLVWNGVPLGMVLIVGLGLWFLTAIRGACDAATLLALAAVAGVFMHALVEYPLEYVYFLLPVGLLMGIVAASALPGAGLRVPVWLVYALMIVAAAALTVVMSDYLALEQDQQSVRFEQARIGLDKPRRELSRPAMLTQIAALLRFTRTPEREGMDSLELQAMADVVRRYPSGPNAVRYAAALALNDHPRQADEVLHRVCKLESERICADMKVLWTELGKSKPAIARIPWPYD